MNFKVGDMVVRNEPNDECDWVPNGTRGTIVKIENGVAIIRDAKGNECRFGHSIEEFKKLEKTMEDLQAGDIILDCDGDEVKILARVGDLVALSEYSFHDRHDTWKAITQLKDDNYKLKVEEEVKEMTVAEVEALVGKKVKIVKE